MGILGWVKSLSDNTLYFPGCLTKAVKKQEFENYKEIFNKLDIAFLLLPEEVCCGAVALNAGYKKDARTLAKKNFELFKSNNIKKIITNCASCYRFFKERYPKLLREWDIEVEHATVTVVEALRKKRINFKGTLLDREPIVYHDSCHLGRYGGIYDEPREIIERLGGRILEFEHNKENALCCGASGGYLAHFPQEAKKAASARVSASPDKQASIVSACVLCHENLSRANDNSIELSTFILNKLQLIGL